MKKIFFITALLNLIYINAQEVIFESELSYKTKSIKHRMDDNYNLLLFFQEKSLSDVPIYKKILFYEDKKFIDLNNENEFSEVNFTVNKDLFFLGRIKGGLFVSTDSFILKRKNENLSEKIEIDLKYSDYFGGINNDNNKNMIYGDLICNVVARKSPHYSYDNRIEKDDLSLLKYNIETKKKEIIDIVKPTIERLKNDTLIKTKVIGYYYEKNNEDSFHIITKAVSKISPYAKIYRTIYDLNGKQIDEKVYNISPLNGTFHYCTIKETALNKRNAKIDSGSIQPTYDLDINSHFIDNNGNFYIFGITNHPKKGPLGFYVYKFDDKGSLDWKKFYPINDPTVFNKDYKSWTGISILSFDYSDTELVINVKAAKDYTDNTHHTFKISRSTGNVEKYISLPTHRKTQFTSYAEGNFELGDKKYCTETFLVAKLLNPKIDNYIKSLNSKDKLNFKAEITPHGIYVIETDTKKYYKVLFFS
ncbi:MAG: hypothetical protein ACK4RM_04185 [Flavobacterium sp.]